MRVNLFYFLSSLSAGIVGCHSTNKIGRPGTGTYLSAFKIADYKAAAGDPDWANVTISLQRIDGDHKTVAQTFRRDQFKADASSNPSVMVAQGTYHISLSYTDAAGTALYRACDDATKRDYLINTPEFKTNIAICKMNQTTPTANAGGTPANTPPNTPATNPLPSGPDPATGGLEPSAKCFGADGRVKSGFDDVGGYCVNRNQSFYIQGGDIYNRGNKIIVKGVNWFGLEGASPDSSGQTNISLKLAGLWTGRSMESFIDEMASLGFNAWRLPLAPESLDPTTPAFDGFKSIPEEIDHFLTYTASKGMLVLLDMHNCGKNRYFTDKPGPGVAASGCATYTEDKWQKDLQTLATIAKAHSNVIGIDLFNEPFGLSWNDWLGMASRGAETVLKTNPNILVFVEGIGGKDSKTTNNPFWGENLFEAATNAPHIPQSRLVFSPHVYGPSVYSQSYFNVPGFPGNMAAIWDEHFGYLKDQGYCLAFGEFGGTYVGLDKTWNDAFVAYIQQKNIPNFFYWAMNQNSGDTGGLYSDSSWRVLNQDKLKLLKPLLDR